MTIARLLGSLEPLKDTAVVALVEDGSAGEPEIRAVSGIWPANGGNATFEPLVTYLADVILREHGSRAAEEAEIRLRQGAGDAKKVTAALCRDLLFAYALPARDTAALETFTAEMPEETLTALGFSSFSPFMRVAVMHGVTQGVVMMENVTSLPERFPDLSEAGPALTPDSVRQAQRELAESIVNWGEALTGALSPQSRPRELPAVMEAVKRLLRRTRSKLLFAFLQCLTLGTISDIFTVQLFMVRELDRFCSQSLPGIQAPTIAAGHGNLLHELLHDAACSHIRRYKGLTVDRLIKAEADMLLHRDARMSLGSLMRLHLNSLLEEMPPPEELRERSAVKGFDAEGFHADFVRDCIALRHSFLIRKVGKLKNAQDREQDVAGGQRDIKFYEQQLAAYEQKLAQGQDADAQELPPAPEAGWERPTVRNSPSMTPEDLKEARHTAMIGIPDRSQRMAVTCLANLVCLRIPQLFFEGDPAPGVVLEGGFRQMDMDFDADSSKLAVSAMVFFDSLRVLKPAPDAPAEAPLDKVSCTHLVFELHLRNQRKNGGNQWKIGKVLVDSTATALIPPRNAPQVGE